MKKLMQIIFVIIFSIFIYGCHSKKLPQNNTYIKPQINIIVDYKYDSIGHFSFGLASAEKKNKYGYINNKGIEIIPFIYESTSAFTESLAAVKRNSKWGFINTSGELIITFEYDSVKEYSEGLCPVKKGDKWGYINPKGEIVLPFIYEEANLFNNGYALVYENFSNHFINKKGEVCFNKGIASEFSEGLACISESVNDEWKYGYMDIEGNITINPQYEYAYDFSEGIAAVKNNGKVGYINKNNEIIIPIKYDSFDAVDPNKFEDGRVSIINDKGKSIWFNKSGEIIKNFNVSYITSNVNGIITARFSLGDSDFIVNDDGKVIAKLDFFVSTYSENMYIVVKNGKYGVVTIRY